MAKKKKQAVMGRPTKDKTGRMSQSMSFSCSEQFYADVMELKEAREESQGEFFRRLAIKELKAAGYACEYSA